MVDLARQLAGLQQAGNSIVLVSSGSMAAGKEVLQFPRLPKAMPGKQMLSAVGQPELMARWSRFFAIYDLRVAQVLLTRSDLRARTRYLNARNTILALLDQGVIPVINENDTVATEEIRVGDNDNLSALVANLINADFLLLLTDQDGLYTADPRTDSQAELISEVTEPEIGPELWRAAGQGGELGIGGMTTKLQAADLARRSGTTVVIARGDLPDVTGRLLAGESLGTRFSPAGSARESFKRYLLSGGDRGQLSIDPGAVQAIVKGRSLLPPGLQAVRGDYERGETIAIVDPAGQEIARGLVNYPSRDCQRLIGKQSVDIETELGYFYGDEIVHRSNLVLI
jgi:glutamate 5-kinase